MISFIIPAYNEERLIGSTLDAVLDAAGQSGEEFEVIVVNDASTDRTKEIAIEKGARLIDVSNRQISKTRNAGAKAAVGELLIFVDADTIVTALAVSQALAALKGGAIGGGALFRFTGNVPFHGILMLLTFKLVARISNLAGGAFLFCRREEFEKAGGYDETIFAAEDVGLCASLKRTGRFVLIREQVETSGRRMSALSGLEMLVLMIKIPLLGKRYVGRRENVEGIWYEGGRQKELLEPKGIGPFLSSLLVVILLLGLLSLPLWLVPWPEFLRASPLMEVKKWILIVLAHFGLLLFPLGWMVIREIMVTKRLKTQLGQLLVLLLCCYFGGRSALGVLWFWQEMVGSFVGS
ncbi:glycosyltransferase [Verrucomicrobia bacterium]|nr:glycosyltransferase [Verrucomicrobiota bacterium]